MKQEENIHSELLVWCDLETTGLEMVDGHILEIALLVTDNRLDIVGEFESVVASIDPRECSRESEGDRFSPDGQRLLRPIWDQHWDSGLMSRIEEVFEDPDYRLDEVQLRAQSFLNSFGLYDTNESRTKPPLCGSTVSFDRRWLERDMPAVFDILHYRNVDVSTIRELQKRWRPDIESPPKSEAHRAMADIKESLDYLQHYVHVGFVNG